ncbi:MAG: CpsD/CapB family tyrosine-protein kinase [Gammaproteobacteria bacterium]|nr:CpsD/CapB family tyrosine-protein kinase [Gammaproteobacteria bacterium]
MSVILDALAAARGSGEGGDAVVAELRAARVRDAGGYLDDGPGVDRRRGPLLISQRVIAAFEEDTRVEPYRQLRTRLLQTMHDNRWNSVAITSAHEGAGKTLTAVNLALSIARDYNHTVLLADLDLRAPTVHEKLGLDVRYGLVDYLRGACELDEAIVNSGFARLAVLPGRALNRFSSELLASPRMKRFMDGVVGRYDPARVTIFDLPPLLRNDDALLFAPQAQCVLLVVEDGVTTEEQLDHSLSLLRKANVVGTLLNKARD